MKMDVVLIILVILVLVDCLLIVGSILLQEDKSGGGIGMIGGSSQSFFGASSGSLMAKITTVLLVIFVVLVLFIAFFSSRSSSGSLITEKSLSQTESLEYETKVEVKKQLDDAPKRIQASDFENEILMKITDEKNKSLMNSSYSKDVTNKYYTLNDKTSKTDKTQITKILNAIGFSMEAKTTVVNTVNTNSLVDTSADVTSDTKK